MQKCTILQVYFTKPNMLKALVSLLISVLALGCSTSQQASGPKLLRECPDEWIVNQQPKLVQPGQEGKADEYYMLRGRRYELKQFDAAWVAKNCRLEPKFVQ